MKAEEINPGGRKLDFNHTCGHSTTCYDSTTRGFVTKLYNPKETQRPKIKKITSPAKRSAHTTTRCTKKKRGLKKKKKKSSSVRLLCGSDHTFLFVWWRFDAQTVG